MADEKDTKIKVTDRRKFNPDGSPREQPEEAAAPQAEQTKPEQTRPEQAQPGGQPAPAPEAQPGNEAAQSNVVSFPSETAKQKASVEPQASPEATPATGQAGAGQQGQGDQASDQNAQAEAAARAAEQAYNQMKPRGALGTPEASFLGLLDMLAGEAAMCLGMVQNPSGAEMPTDLDAARQIIDMLGMLQQKTNGNLNAEEKDVLENILAYLRIQFVALSRNK